MIYSLDYIVSSCLADIGEPDTSPLYIQMLKWANDGYRRLNLAGLMPITFKTVTLDIDFATNTAVLPDDYDTYLKIGIVCNGVLINFAACDNIYLRDTSIQVCKTPEEIRRQIDVCCGTVSQAEGAATDIISGWGGVSWFYPYYQHYHNGQFMAGYYGVGAGFNNGGFKINLQTGRIQFDSCVRLQQVVMEYISTGINSTGDALIQQTSIPALMAFVHKQRCSFSRDMKDKQDYNKFANQFTREQRALNSRQNALTLTEWYKLFRSVTYQTAKR